MLRCYNRGCGKEYDPEKNNEDSCRHHPGAPYFHDAYKGWSCCNKKSVDFTEFLSIKGCTVSKHSNIKPSEPVKSNKTEKEKHVKKVRAPICEPKVRPPLDTPMIVIQPTVDIVVKDIIENLSSKSAFSDNSVDSASVSTSITIGTICKNSGCNNSYSNTAADNDECQYHSGVPIFHEGMKYWSCCQRKTSDFAVFMAQKGCSCGKHKWLKDNDEKTIQCRYDWHQTATDIVVTIYAKKYHYAESIIEVNPIRLHVIVLFPDQDKAKFDLDLELRGIIEVEKTTAHMYGTKIEIIMPKAEPATWPKLDFPQKKTMQSESAKDDFFSTSKSARQTPEDTDNFNLNHVDILNKSAHLSEVNT